MTAVTVGLVLAIGMVALSVVVKRAGDTISRGVDGCSEACRSLLSQSEHGPSTDPQLAERLEAVERRVALALDDLQKQYRKLAQERRRLGQQLGEEEELDEDQLELAQQLLQQRERPGPAPSSDGRPRLRRR